jgi:hypothetical protein
MSKYYRGGQQDALQAIRQIREQGCRFLVFGRAVDDRFVTLPDLKLVPELGAICDTVGENDFRIDVSSAEIRKSQQANPGGD